MIIILIMIIFYKKHPKKHENNHNFACVLQTVQISVVKPQYCHMYL